jgi:phosphate transport system protein
MVNQHTVTSFDDELRFLSDKIAAMGGHAEWMIENAVQALVRSDVDRAGEIVVLDKKLDELQRDIDEKAIGIIARRQPMAGDLRDIMGSVKIAADLERVGDLAKNVAKRVVSVAEQSQPLRLYRGLEALADLAQLQVKEVLDAYATRSPDRLEVVRDRDDEIDAMYTSLFRELLTYMMEDPRNISACTHLLFCAKNIERIGDHATNIAETVFYMSTGRQLPAERPKEDESHAITVAAETSS